MRTLRRIHRLCIYRLRSVAYEGNCDAATNSAHASKFLFYFFISRRPPQNCWKHAVAICRIFSSDQQFHEWGRPGLTFKLTTFLFLKQISHKLKIISAEILLDIFKVVISNREHFSPSNLWQKIDKKWIEIYVKSMRLKKKLKKFYQLFMITKVGRWSAYNF